MLFCCAYHTSIDDRDEVRYCYIIEHMENTAKDRSHHRFVLYILGFLFAFQAVLPAYIFSTFLSQFVGEQKVGILYTLAAIATIASFACIPRVMKGLGNYHTTVIMLTLQLGAFLAMAYSQSVWLILLAFIISFTAGAITNFTLDAFLENYSTANNVGKVRGIFLTSANLAWIAAPLVTGFILTDSQYWQIFVAAAFLILPVMMILNTNLRHFHDPRYTNLPLMAAIRAVWRNENIFGSFMVSFIMQLFFSWMVIYTPLYLHQHIGFSWAEIGVMFSIMLLPFVLIEAPLGKLADTRWGEKEIISIGFIIMAISTGMIAFIEKKEFWVWTVILFVTRIGAAMVEIGSETYFFKKIDGASVNFMSLYRTMRPWSYVIGPLLATATLAILTRFHIDFAYIFLVLGILMFYGLRWSLVLEDTK